MQFLAVEGNSSFVKWAEGKNHRAIFQALLKELACSDISLAPATSIRRTSLRLCAILLRGHSFQHDTIDC